MRRLLITILMVVGLATAIAHSASAAWVCVSVVEFDKAVCQNDPLPGPPPLPGIPDGPSEAVL